MGMKNRFKEKTARLNGYYVASVSFLKRYRTLLASSVAILFFAIASLVTPTQSSVEGEVDRLEKRLQNRERQLERYALEALDNPVDQWYKPKDFPEDMVIYKYNADTLQCWVNQFPISNDEVDAIPLWYTLGYANSENIWNMPLAYLSDSEQYVNLGSAWYVVKVYKKERAKVIAGLLVKTEYLSDNSVLVNEINPELKVKRELEIVPINFDNGIMVEGMDGNLLFTVIDEVDSLKAGVGNIFKWLTFLFVLLALISYFMNNISFKSLLIYVAALSLLRVLLFIFASDLRFSEPLFSPNIYSGGWLFSSLGNLLINNFYVCLAVYGIYLLRSKIVISKNRVSGFRKVLLYTAVFLLPVLLSLYIHYTFMSLLKNSNVMLEIYRLTEMDFYSFLCYLSYGLLFISLLLSLQLAMPFTPRFGRHSLFSTKYLLAYIAAISVYSVVVMGIMGYQKEQARCRVWSNRLSVERDLSLELQLANIEGKLSSDVFIREMLSMRNNPAMPTLLRNRLDELYFYGVSQKYEITLTVCRPNESLVYNDGQRLVDCNGHFQQEVINYGTNISDKYFFFFLNNHSGRISYLGIFTYEDQTGPITLYIELNSRYMKDISGYTSLLFDYKRANDFRIPGEYSYAKYVNNRLVLYGGDYNYPVSFNKRERENGFFTVVQDNYRHFANKLSDDNIIVISRQKQSIFDFFISFSYMMLFFSAMFFIFLRYRHFSNKILKSRHPRNRFRRRLTYFISISLVISLLCLGVGSIWFTVKHYDLMSRVQMEEKIQTAQSTISEYCKYKQDYTEINTLDLSHMLDRIAVNAQVDINLYDPHGRLIRSTQPELFKRNLFSSRMDSDAYYLLTAENKRHVINRESIGELSYISLYSPIFNADGSLIAYVNIPYFTKTSSLWGNLTSMIAIIINIYILLMLAAIFAGTVISNSISKPIEEIGRKMRSVDVSRKAEHVDYDVDDELGVLVKAYNKMVDDLEESTKRLTQSEREQAWSEMARQIAHEIKNPLTPMRLSIQYLVRLKQKNIQGWEDKFEQVADSILEQIDILSDTASEFSSFAKFYYEESSVLNLHEIIFEQRVLFDNRENIKILISSESDECYVYARKGQIIRVVVNLLSNAVQAVESRGGGYIRISITQAGGNYTVSFEDNGPGVKDEDLDKLFKPNFTTKTGGTGLGLAISRNIIEQSGGTIFYRKSDLGGANFSFTLPVYLP